MSVNHHRHTRTLTALMIAGAAVLGLAGCGDDGESEAEASAAYVDAGNALCVQIGEAINAAFPDFEGEPTIEQVMSLGAALGPVMQDFRDGVAALDSPEDLADQHATLLDELDASIETLESMATTESGAQAALDAGGPPLDAPANAAHAIFPSCPPGE